MNPSQRIKLSHARHDAPLNEPQSVPDTCTSHEHSHEGSLRAHGSKIRLPISPSFFKTYGISKVLPPSLGRDAILEAEVGLLEFQRCLAEQSEEEEPNEEPAELNTLDLFRDLRMQCEILSPFAGNQATSVCSSISTAGDRKRPYECGEIKGPGRDRLTNLVDHSIPLLLNHLAYDSQIRAYVDLHGFMPTQAPSNPSGEQRASTILDARLMIYFLGVVQSFSTYLLKGVAGIVERDASRTYVKPQDLLSFIGEDEMMAGFWDLFELTRTKALIERATSSSTGSAYHHRSNSFGVVSPESSGKRPSGTFPSTSTPSENKPPNNYAYLFKNHKVYTDALQQPAPARPGHPSMPSRRGQSNETYRIPSHHISTGSVSTPPTTQTAEQIARSPRTFVSGTESHAAHRKPVHRKTSKSPSTASSSSHQSPITSVRGLREQMADLASSTSSISGASHDIETGSYLKRAPSLSRRSANDHSSSTSSSTGDRASHHTKWSVSSTSYRDESVDSRRDASRAGDATIRSLSSTSTTSNTSSQAFKKVNPQSSFSNLNQKFTSMIQGQGHSAPGRSRSRTAGSSGASKHASSPAEFDASRFPTPSSFQDDRDRREFTNTGLQHHLGSIGGQFASQYVAPPEETLDQPDDAFEQLITSGRTMKVTLTPGRFRFPGDKTAPNSKLDGVPDSGELTIGSPIELNSQTSRSLKSSVPHLEPRIELRPQHRRVSEQVVSNAGASHPSKAGLATSSGSGSSAKSAPNDVDRNREAFGWQNTKDKDAAGGPELNLDDEDEDFGKQLRPSDDFASFKDMLDSDPPWLAPSDPPAPSDLSAPSAQSQSKIKGLVSFSMKKSASGTAKKRATGSSINVKQIGEPSMLYSSASIAGSQTEPLPGGPALDWLQSESQFRHPRNPSQSTLDVGQGEGSMSSEVSEDAKAKRRGFKSIIAKLKGKDDLLLGLQQAQPQFVTSAIGGINPRMKAAEATSASFTPDDRGSNVFPPHPTAQTSPNMYAIPRVRPPQLVKSPQTIRTQRSSPMMSLHADPRPEHRNLDAVLKSFGSGSGMSNSEQTYKHRASQLQSPTRTLDIRSMSSASTHSPRVPLDAPFGGLINPSPTTAHSRLARAGWETNLQASPFSKPPPVPPVPESLRTSRDSSVSRSSIKSTDSHHKRLELSTPPPVLADPHSPFGTPSTEHSHSLSRHTPSDLGASQTSRKKRGNSSSRASERSTDSLHEKVEKVELLSPPPLLAHPESPFGTPLMLGPSPSTSLKTPLESGTHLEPGKQRTITSGSNSSEASNQTIRLMHRSSSNNPHSLLTPPHSPLEATAQYASSEIRRPSSVSTNPSSSTPGLTSAASVSSQDSSSSNANTGSQESRLEELPEGDGQREWNSRDRLPSSTHSRRSPHSAVSPTPKIPERRRPVDLSASTTAQRGPEPPNARAGRASEGFQSFKGAEVEPEQVFGRAVGGEEEERGFRRHSLFNASGATEVLDRLETKITHLAGNSRQTIELVEVMELLESERQRVESEFEKGSQPPPGFSSIGQRKEVMSWLLDA